MSQYLGAVLFAGLVVEGLWPGMQARLVTNYFYFVTLLE